MLAREHQQQHLPELIDGELGARAPARAATVGMLAFLCAVLASCSCGVADAAPESALSEPEAMHTAAITALAVDRDYRFLVTASKDKSVRVWQLQSGRLERVIRPPSGDGHEGEVYALAISPDGKTIACGGYTGKRTDNARGGKTFYDVYLFDRANGDLLRKIPVPFIAQELAYSKDGAFLVATSLDAFDSVTGDFGADRVFSTTDYSWARKAFPSDGGAKALADFDAKGRLFIIQKFGMWVIDIKRRGDNDSESRQVYGIPTSLSVSPDGSKLAVGFADSTVRVYSSEDLSVLYEPDVKGIGPAEVEFTDAMELTPAGLSTLAWSVDGSSLYYAGGRTCAAGSCFVRRWSDGGRGPFNDVPASRSRITSMVALDGARLAYATADPAIGVLDAENKRTLFVENADRAPGADTPPGVEEAEIHDEQDDQTAGEAPGQGCLIFDPERFPSDFKEGKWGYVDTNGTFAIPPQFDYASSFSEGLAVAAPKTKLGYIDKSGRFAIDPKFDPPIGDFKAGLAVVNDGDKYGFIDKTGKMVIPPKFASVGDFSEGLAQAGVTGKGYGYIDAQGTLVVRPQFDEAKEFSEGLAAVEKNGTWRYIDKVGATVGARRFDAAWPFAEGLARVREKPCTDERCTEEYIDTTGRTVIRAVRPQQDGNFSDGLAMIEGRAHGYGFIDKSGKTVIPPSLEQALPFAEGLAAVRKEDRWGYIDRRGRMVIEPQFEAAGSFAEGRAEIRKDEKWGFIDKTGKIVIQPQFDDVAQFSEGLAAVCIVTDSLDQFPKPSAAIDASVPSVARAQAPASAAVPDAPRGTESLALSPPQLNTLADLHRRIEALAQKQAYLEALPLAHQAFDLVEDANLGDDPALVQPLLDLARVNYALGAYRQVAGESALTMDEFRKARESFQRALAIREENPTAGEAELIALLDEEGAQLRTMGEYDEAADVFRRVLDLRAKALGPDDPQTAKSRSDVASVRVMKLAQRKEFVDAFAAAQSALEAAEPVLGPDHPSVALALANIADLYSSFRASFLEAATELHERALAIRERALGPNHWEVSASLRSLGDVYGTRQEYDRAERLYERALHIEEAVLGPQDPALATMIEKLGRFHQSLKHYAEAERLYRRALAIREAEGEAYKVASALDGLSDLYRAQGLHAQAAPFLVRELSLRERFSGANHYKTAETLRSLGTVYRVTGAYARAEPLYERAVAIHQQHADDAQSWALRDLAALGAAKQRYRSALGTLAQSVSAQESSFQILFRPGPEEQQFSAIESRYVSGSYFFLLALVTQHFRGDGQAVRDALQLVLRRKGLVFEAQSSARARLGDHSDAFRQKWDQLSAARARLSSLLLHKPAALGEDEYRKQLSLLFEQVSALESALATWSSRSSEHVQDDVSVDRVSAALPAKAALVEFVEIPDFDYARADFDFPNEQWQSASRYLAFVLKPNGQVDLIDLGAAAPLDAKIRLVAEDMRSQATAWREHLRDLHSRVWAPLEPSLGGVETVVVSPDGALNLVPFAALRDAKGHYLLERYLVAYLSAGRELLAGEPPAQPSSDLLLVADPNFEATNTPSPWAGPSSRSQERLSPFQRLEGTKREADEVAPLISGAERTVLTGVAATEGAVKGARSPRIMHLATHGFFLPGQRFATDEARHENSLVRSGLAFAGANHAAQTTEGDDGLLTALEVTAMDLSGTYLVVLSACNTGVGEVETGEGVVGLRRAFALAGAQNVMMSLWRVDDSETANQMKRFYQDLRTMAPAQALREAQLESIRALTERDGEALPWLWAPFIVEGGHAFGATS